MECMQAFLFHTSENCSDHKLRFLLAQLHMNTLKNQPTKGDIKQALQHLAKGIDGLNETYEQTMKRINDQGSRIRGIAKQILGWIVHAKRPLSTAELRHALAVRQDTAKLDEDFLPSVQTIQSVCAGLVIADEQSKIIRLVHYTTQEYFEHKWTAWFPDAHKDITNACVTYLSFDQFNTGFCQSNEVLEERLQTNALYDYAARFWGSHASKAHTENDGILKLLRNKAKVSAASQVMISAKRYLETDLLEPTQLTGLHVAAYFGLEQATNGLLDSESDPDDAVDLKDRGGQTPLLLAAKHGHELVVKALLNTNQVNINSQNNLEATPLLLAAMNGHDAVVKLLLDTGLADVNAKNKDKDTPLLWAAMNGHDAVVKLLLDTGLADVNAKNKDKDTPLLWAAMNGHDAVVKLLLDTGLADVNAKDKDKNTPLLLAAMDGHDAVVKLLLDTGLADVNAKDKDKETPLLLAATNGYDAVVKLLLNTGLADVNAKDENKRTPLLLAVMNGYDAVVKLLLDIGLAEVNAKTEDEETPLFWAAKYGHKAVVKLLLDTGRVDVNSKNYWGELLLSQTVKKDHEGIVKLLLETGKININLKDLSGHLPLCLAKRTRNEAMVNLLRSHVSLS
jgi:ankyrin repeat protein